MSDKKQMTEQDNADVVIARAKDFWGKWGNKLTILSAVIILAVGGWYVYQKYFRGPREIKASEAMFRAEDYFRKDSLNLALNGDGQALGFLKVIERHKGTKAANLAHFYAGACYVRLNENEKAVKYLKDFSTSSKQLQARAYKLLGDAYGDLGKFKEAFDAYKKAGHAFEKDEFGSAESLFLAAYLAQRQLNDTKSATELYQEIKQKYPRTDQAREAETFLAQMGVYSEK